jgi:hypothetical protein
MGYLNPRISSALALPTGIHGVMKEETSVSVYPNPSRGNVQVTTLNASGNISEISVIDATGRVVFKKGNIRSKEYILPRSSFTAGVYYMKIVFEKGQVIRKITFQ